MDSHRELQLDAETDEVTEGRRFSRWTRICCLLTTAIFFIASCGDDKEPLLPVGPSTVAKHSYPGGGGEGEGDGEWSEDGWYGDDDNCTMLNVVGALGTDGYEDGNGTATTLDVANFRASASPSRYAPVDAACGGPNSGRRGS